MTDISKTSPTVPSETHLSLSLSKHTAFLPFFTEVSNKSARFAIVKKSQERYKRCFQRPSVAREREENWRSTRFYCAPHGRLRGWPNERRELLPIYFQAVPSGQVFPLTARHARSDEFTAKISHFLAGHRRHAKFHICFGQNRRHRRLSPIFTIHCAANVPAVVQV